MKKASLNLLIALILSGGGDIQASEVIKLQELDKPAVEWIVDKGTPLYYSTDSRYLNFLGEQIGPEHLEGSEVNLRVSPDAKKRVVSLLESLDQVKEGQRMTDYYVFDQYDQLEYTVTQGSGVDLKAPVAAISNDGVLALVDPISAQIQLYQGGDKIAETPLYRSEGDYSLERNAFVDWVQDRCYILIEHPGINGAPARNALMISIDAQGRDQITSVLPFTYLLDHVFEDGRFFMSGYSYDPAGPKWTKMIVETSAQGKILWTNANFGHELAISRNGDYLAARKSHDAVVLFDLARGKVEEITFEQDGKVALGLNVTNRGTVGLIRVPSDFFVKQNSFHSEVFFPQSQSTIDVELNPRMPAMFQLYCDGHRMMLGTQYEWLEIRE
ncbi:MAG: hypothetical protein K9M49_09735 [Candidatus Marinimicrobia bacterium]|nr:hypothetical protein [Candidatus Neomarinimicrobiota bacterium]MCF7850952.1 hypothetical protein [Candidatus Neomarinimicrobiota bacterium]MCF7905414.1 hypothetical protein [Candidatus Neomarinimicrobiota bacterium]